MPKITPVRGLDEKWCSGCKDFRPLGEFHKNAKRKDGLASWCKRCVDEYEKSYKHVRAKRKEKLVKTGDYDSWWSDKARRNNLNLNPKELKKYYKESPYCYYCGIKLVANRFHLDHKNPRSRGGTDELRVNLVITCEDCNRLKHTRTEEEFLDFVTEYCQRFTRK